jgi:hypothetical protein
MPSQRRIPSLFLLAMLGLALALSLSSAQPTWAENTKRMLKRGGDFDGHGKKDLAVFNTATATWKYIRSSDGRQVTFQFGDPGSRPVPGDYDKDGKTDMATWYPDTGRWSIRSSETGQVYYRHLGIV